MSTGKHCMKKRLTLNTVAVASRAFSLLSQRCALRAGGRPQRGGAALARGLLRREAPMQTLCNAR